jgi:hypothetical protein
LGFEEPDCNTAVQEILARADYIKKVMPTVANNLKIAQHRDQMRYAATRDGNYLPQLRRLQPGDYVWVKRNSSNNTLQITARQDIYRVVELLPLDAVRVQGKCGTMLTVHRKECARCHLPYIEGAVNPELAHPPKTQGCEECRFTNGEALLLCCDGCGQAWHTSCLTPPLEQVPVGKWVCESCNRRGITVEVVKVKCSSRNTRRRRQRSCSPTKTQGTRTRQPQLWMATEYVNR